MSIRQWRDATGRPRSRGQALVELALILPVLLLMLAAALDLGRLFYSQITVNDAAREGALEAARNPGSYIANTACTTANKDANRVMCRTLNEARGGMVTVTPADVNVTCTPSPCPASPSLGDTVAVRVTGHFQLITPLLSGFFGGQSVTFASTASAQLNATPNSALPAPPVASFTAVPPSGPAPLSVTFTDTSTGAPTSWTWNFGDGQTAGVQGPHGHVYSSPGSYLVQLSVSNAGGSSTASATISVSAPAPGVPVALFTATPASGAPPLVVTFTNSSTGSPTTWAWNFGDGQTSTVQNPPPHTYAGIGNYTVALTVANASGSSTVTHPVTTTAVCVAPTASFTLNVTSGKKKKDAFVATDTSTNMANAGCNNIWSWNFGDGSGVSSNKVPPGHTYQASGIYTIQLGVSNSAGTATTSRVVTVTN